MCILQSTVLGCEFGGQTNALMYCLHFHKYLQYLPFYMFHRQIYSEKTPFCIVYLVFLFHRSIQQLECGNSRLLIEINYYSNFLQYIGKQILFVLALGLDILLHYYFLWLKGQTVHMHYTESVLKRNIAFLSIPSKLIFNLARTILLVL